MKPTTHNKKRTYNGGRPYTPPPVVINQDDLDRPIATDNSVRLHPLAYLLIVFTVLVALASLIASVAH